MNLSPFKLWLESRRRSPHTVRAYLSDLTQCEALGPLDKLSEMVGALHGRGENPSTIRRRIGTLKTYWAFMRESGQTTQDPFKDFNYKPSKKRRLREYLSHAQVLSLFTDPPKHLESAALAVEIMYWTGLRSAEYLSLEGKSITLSGKQSVIGKGDKERVVIIPAHLVDRLCRIQGRLYPKSYQSLWREIRELGKWKGLKTHPHLIRHAAITQLLESGMDSLTVSRLAGHESVNTTKGYYHPSSDHLQSEVLKRHPMGRA